MTRWRSIRSCCNVRSSSGTGAPLSAARLKTLRRSSTERARVQMKCRVAQVHAMALGLARQRRVSGDDSGWDQAQFGERIRDALLFRDHICVDGRVDMRVMAQA